VPGVPSEILVPRTTWPDTGAYDEAARRLAAMFHDNFATYADGVSGAIRNAGPAPVDPDLGAEG
jgi:phosphoenolpyruvate carboxykinase (ATP)